MLTPMSESTREELDVNEAKKEAQQLATLQLDLDKKKEAELKNELAEINERRGKLHMQASGREPARHQITLSDVIKALEYALNTGCSSTDALSYVSKINNYEEDWVDTVRRSQRHRLAKAAINSLKGDNNKHLKTIIDMGCFSPSELTKPSRTISGLIKELNRQYNIAKKLNNYPALEKENKHLREENQILTKSKLIKEWQRKALQLRKEGKTKTEIGKLIGKSRETVTKFINNKD